MQQTNAMADPYIGLGGGGQFPAHEFNPTQNHNPFLLPPSIPYGGLFNWRPSGGPLLDQQYVAEQLQKMSGQEMMDAKALAASKSHSEAERRRRERINNHLAKLRSLLPNTTKTDKASLLAEVIQHLKELKRQTSLISETSGPVPTETNKLTVDNVSDEDGRLLIRASICCEDRSGLLSDLINTLKALRLRTLKADMTTLGGRITNVLFFTGENDPKIGNTDDVVQHQQYCLSAIHEALKGIVDKSNGDESGSSSAKRQRTILV